MMLFYLVRSFVSIRIVFVFLWMRFLVMVVVSMKLFVLKSIVI